LGDEIWRLRKRDRVITCELLNDTRAGRGWEVQLLENGKVLFSKRCAREGDARCYAAYFRQDHVRTGFGE
jgi:hypothetical protein